MDDDVIEKSFLSEAYHFQEAVNAFGQVIREIHDAYKADKYFDWPTVLLSTLLQTTALSLYQLFPKGDLDKSPGIVDRRSIASLIRNIVDTHDVIDLLCDMSQPEDTFNLHRDIMGYYLSGRLHAMHGRTKIPSFFSRMDKTRDRYWKNICKALPDKMRTKRLKSGESLFYLSRKERIEKCCGVDSDLVRKVLSDLSSYVHSVPPSLWMKTLEAAFSDDKETRGVLTVWLRITNFYYARSINIVLSSFATEIKNPLLTEYISNNRTVFSH